MRGISKTFISYKDMAVKCLYLSDEEVPTVIENEFKNGWQQAVFTNEILKQISHSLYDAYDISTIECRFQRDDKEFPIIENGIVSVVVNFTNPVHTAASFFVDGTFLCVNKDDAEPFGKIVSEAVRKTLFQ